MTNPNITPELERGARAMYEARLILKPVVGDPLSWDFLVEQGWPIVDKYRSLAATCLRSLLPPSESAIKVGHAAYGWQEIEYGLDDEDLALAFTAMIKHVLGER